MDRKFGAPWNVVIGEYFSFEITYEARFSMGLRGAPPPPAAGRAHDALRASAQPPWARARPPPRCAARRRALLGSLPAAHPALAVALTERAPVLSLVVNG